MHWKEGEPYRIALFYRYVAIDDVNAEMLSLRQRCETLGLLGRVLVSKEGLNGTLAGGVSAISTLVAEFNLDPRFAKIDWKFTDDSGDQLPFLGLSIREVDEIISCGRAKAFISENTSFDSESYGGIAGTGTHLTPQQFHEAIARKDGVVLDIRNEFEYDIGHFDGSKNLKTFNYAETFDVLDEIVPLPARGADVADATVAGAQSDRQTEEQPNIYMYCTGGIRCEKASAYLCAKGFKKVFQLEGGIHRYLETYPDGGLFHGKNFVFDSRVAVAPTAAASGTTDLSNPGRGDGSAEVAGAVAVPVVGRCIDCDAAHDVYSGHIVCTVCRMPVLVCPTCVASCNPPGEYHCSRHRDLKHVYFTVLTHFTTEQLQAQAQALRQLEAESATHMEKVRAAERVSRRRAASALHAKKHPEDDVAEQKKHPDSDAAFNGEQAEAVSASAVVTTDSAVATEEVASGEVPSKQRRRTLRKQIERIEAYLQKRVQVLQQEDPQSLASSEEAEVAEFNPKTRGGWGFWKS